MNYRDIFEEGKPDGEAGREPAIANENRHLRELNRYRKPKGAAQRLELDSEPAEKLQGELANALKGYPQTEKLDRDKLLMEGLIEKLLSRMSDYQKAAVKLDRPKKSWLSMIVGSSLEFIVLLLDVVLFTFTFTVVLIAVTEKQRLPPEQAQLVTIGAIFAVAAAAGVKMLAFYASKYPVARVVYVVPWLLFASADFYYLSKQGNANIGLALTAFLILLCAASYYTARHSAENPMRRKDLLDQYDHAHAAFQKTFLRWRKNLQSMRKDPTAEIHDGLIIHDDKPEEETPEE